MIQMKRQVRLRHVGGSFRDCEEVTILPEKQHVAVQWPTHGQIWFHYGTGLEVGAPRGPWRLDEPEREYYCRLAGIRPVVKKLRPLKPRAKKLPPENPKQLWLVK